MDFAFYFFLTLAPLADIDCTRASGKFAVDVLTTHESQESASKSATQNGYSVPPDLLSESEISICPIPPDSTLEESGMEVFSIRSALQNAGITEETVNLNLKSQRLALGQVLLKEISEHFQMATFHLADTSRVDGGAIYGEATVRNTSSPNLRGSHHAFHIDKFLPGICELHNRSSNLDALNLLLDAYHHLWAPDIEREYGIGSLDKIAKAGIHVNVWVALSQGEIKQKPLVLVHPGSISLSPDSFYTMPVNFPGLNDNISLLKFNPSRDAQYFWVPDMKFGDLLVFSTFKTAHSSVELLNHSTKSRESAEMRMLLFEYDDMKEEL
jgi:hypothetical protein